MNTTSISTPVNSGTISVDINNDTKQVSVTFTTETGNIIDLASVDMAIINGKTVITGNEAPDTDPNTHNAIRLQLFADPKTEDPTDTKYVMIDDIIAASN